jgi:GTPase
VGFIRNLPTTLVSAFRATLEEVQRAALLLHVSDATSLISQEQQQQVEHVLDELGVRDTVTIRVLNKIDLMPEVRRKTLRNGPSVAYVSAAKKMGLDELLTMIDDRLQVDAIRRMKIRVPQTEGRLLALIEARARVAKRAYRDSAVQMEVDAPESLARSLEKFVVVPRNRAAKSK